MRTETSRERRPIKFEPYPLPLDSPLAQDLELYHQKYGFRFSDHRETAFQVQALAVKHGYKVERYRGSIVTGGYELNNRVWSSALDPESQKLLVIEPSLPLRSPEFLKCFGYYAAGDIEADILEAIAKEAPFAATVLGEFPDYIDFIGQPVWD